jgi:hypothetical protein
VLDGNVELATGSIITGAATAFGTDAAAQVAQIGKITGGEVTITGTVATASTGAAELAAFAAIDSTNVIATSSAITSLSSVTDFVVAKGNVITLGSVTVAQNITVNGTLKVPSGAATFAPTGDIVVDAGGELNLAGSANLTVAVGKTLTLNGAASTGGGKLTGEGTLKVGKTTITGGSDNGWQAVGTGTSIAIGPDTITGTGTGATLKAIGTGDNGIIAVAAISGTDAMLTVTSATIDIDTGGNVTLTGNDDSDDKTATLLLKGGSSAAALLIDSTKDTPVITIGSMGLVIGGSDGTTNPAEIKVGNGTTTSATVTNVVVLAADADVSSAKLVGKLGAGGTATTYDLSIVSGTPKTIIVKGDGILGS